MRLSADYQVLYNLAKVQFATIYNFSPFLSEKATTIKGSLIWATVLFKKLEKQELIRRIPLYGRYGRAYKFNTFYTPTAKGFKVLEGFEPKYLEPKSVTQMMHQSALIDCMLGFIYGFPDYDIEIDYNFVMDGYKPDALIRMTGNDGNRYDFAFELERTRSPQAIKKEKLSKNDKINPAKHGLSEKTKFLYVYAHERYNVFARPVEYDRSS